MSLLTRRDLLLSTGVALAATGLAPSLFAAASRTASLRPATTMLSDRLALITGVGGNVLALQGDEGMLLIDSGESRQSRALQAQLKKLAKSSAAASRGQVRTVINTHWHADHTGGNDVFKKDGAEVIAHAKAKQRMATPQYLPGADRYTQARAGEALPSKVFYTGTQSLKFADEQLDYGYLLEAHTDGDLYVYFRNANVLAIGDAAAPFSDPELCWFEGGWLGGRVDSLKHLLTLGNDSTRVVVGRGAVVGKVELKTELEALQKAFERISESMRNGFTTEDMQQAKVLDGLARTWVDPNKFIYDAHKGMWAHHNKLSHSVV